MDEKNKLIGVLSRRDILQKVDKNLKLRECIKKEAVYIREQDSIRVALRRMSREKVGRLVIVNSSLQPVAILTRTDLLHAVGLAED